MRPFRIAFLTSLSTLLSFLIIELYAQDFTVKDTEAGIEIREGDQKVLFYQKSPKSLNGQYERANYVHPLYGLHEEILTEDFPEDHLHQRGIFWTWHQIVVNGKKVADGWTCENIAWDVQDAQAKTTNKQAILKATILWKSALNDDQPVPIVRENTQITVYKSTSQFRMIDFKIALTALVDSLQIGGSEDAKGYGGFSPRFKLPDDIQFISQQQEVTPQETAVTAGPWMDFYGSYNGENAPKSGIAIFSHPDNPGHPQPWILRAEKSMQNAVYPGRYPVDLPEGEVLTLRYRLVIHSSDIDQNSLEELYKQYARD